jgi:neutral ceramidase
MTKLFDRLSFLGCILLILGAPAGGLIAAGAEPAGGLRAGAAAVDITPPLGERVIGGFEPFPSTKIHDNLYARCLVLDNGEAQIAFVICDNLGIIRDVYDEARERIAKETKLPPLNILMAATHTHSGTRSRSNKYRPVVVQGIVEAVRGALANLEPAKIGWGGIDEPSEVFNRRWFVSDPERLKNPFGGVDKVRMNPGQNHPSLVKPASPVDPEVSDPNRLQGDRNLVRPLEQSPNAAGIVSLATMILRGVLRLRHYAGEILPHLLVRFANLQRHFAAI